MSGDPVQPGTNNANDARSRSEAYIYGVAGAGLLVCTLTGFGPVLTGDAVAGWPLLLHMTAAPLFIVGLVMVAIVRAERCRFGDAAPVARGRMNPLRKAAFWIGLLAGLSTLVTMLAAMLPVFGYAAQETLIAAHEVSALVLLIAAVVHFAPSLIAGRAER
jgi:hypothetical protein